MTGRVVNRTRALLPLFCVLCVLFSLPTPLRADEIRLRNGGVVEGRIVAETKTRLVIEVPYGRMTVDRADVLEIIRESEAEYLKEASERVFRAGDIEEALALLRRRLELEPENGALVVELRDQLLRAAESFLERRRVEPAEEVLEEFITRGGSTVDAAPIRKRLESLVAARSEREGRARRAWEEGSIETAHRLWSELRQEYPHLAERWRRPLAAATLRLGHDALLGRRLDRARTLYLETLELDPDRLPDVREPFALCEIERVRPRLQEGRYAEADRELSLALEVLPDEPALLFHRALIVEAVGDYREAAKIYARLAGEKNRAIEGQKYLDSLRTRAAERVQSGVALAFREETAPRISSPEQLELRHSVSRGPFVVRHAKGTDPVPVLEALVRQLTRYEREWFGGRSALPRDLEVEVFLHPGRAELLSGDAPQLDGCDGYVRTERKFGILVSQEMHLNSEAPRLITGVVPHELAHLLLPHRAGRGIEFSPWLDEGIACAMEPKILRLHRERAVREALAADTLFPLDLLLGAREIPSDRVGLFYAQSLSVVAFLQDRLGFADFLEFARKSAIEGLEPALSEVAGYDTVADLQLAWQRSLAE